MTSNRVPAGTPAGGRFAPGTRGRADVTITGLFGTVHDVLNQQALNVEAERCLGAALNWAAAAKTPGTSPEDAAFRRGMEFADTLAAASFLNPRDREARQQIATIIQLAIHRGAVNSDESRAAILAEITTRGLRHPGPVPTQVAETQLKEMIGAVAICHRGVYGTAPLDPDGPPQAHSPHQWEQIGQRNTFAEAAARWATPGAGDHTRRTEAIRAALTDGITNPDTLLQIATGRLERDRDGDWVDPYGYLDDLDD